MSRMFLTAVVLAATATAGMAAENRKLQESLEKLAPSTRLEQVCDIEAMNAIGRSAKEYRPDRAIIYALGDPKVQGDTMRGSGGAFRSAGKWYQFSFTCKTSPDHMKVESFNASVGRLVPESEWAEHGLYR